MTRLGLLLGVLALATMLAGGSAGAQDRALIAIGLVDGDTVVFVDTASVSSRGGSSEVDYVMVPPPGDDVVFEVLRLRIDCRTRRPALVSGRAFASVTGEGEPIPREDLGALDWEASPLLMAAVCGQGVAEAQEAFPSLAAALAHARAQQARIAEFIRPPTTYRLQRVTQDEAGVSYIDITSRERAGDEVTFWTYAVFHQPVRPTEDVAAFQSMLIMVTADCAQGRFVTHAIWLYGPDGELLVGGPTSGEAEDVTAEGMRTALDAACRAPSTSAALTSLADARADARRRR